MNKTEVVGVFEVGLKRMQEQSFESASKDLVSEVLTAAEEAGWKVGKDVKGDWPCYIRSLEKKGYVKVEQGNIYVGQSSDGRYMSWLYVPIRWEPLSHELFVAGGADPGTFLAKFLVAQVTGDPLPSLTQEPVAVKPSV